MIFAAADYQQLRLSRVWKFYYNPDVKLRFVSRLHNQPYVNAPVVLYL